jgi:DNA-directed RNA polymerase subunit RPC12/RpoP
MIRDFVCLNCRAHVSITISDRYDKGLNVKCLECEYEVMRELK